MKTTIRYNGRPVASLGQLNRILSSRANDAIRDVLSDVAIQMAEQMRELTPVRTGNAQSNWHVSDFDVEPVYQERSSSGSLNVSGLSGKSNKIKISNPTPYIDDLEFGFSNQAPSGMMRITALSYRDFVTRAVIRNKR